MSWHQQLDNKWRLECDHCEAVLGPGVVTEISQASSLAHWIRTESDCCPACVPPEPDPEPGLTAAELEITGQLGECFNQFRGLAEQHLWDTREFMHAIHAAQDIVMSRAARRAHPDVFTNLEMADREGE